MSRYSLPIVLAGAIIFAAFLVGNVSAPTPAAAASCTGTWQYQESDISDASCVNPAPGICVPNPNNTNFYSALATCPSANPDASPCTVGSPVLLQNVSGPRVYGSHCKWNSVEGNSNLVQTAIYACVDSSGAPIPTSCGTASQTVTANLVANPTSVTLREPVSMLTWSSTGATSCSGNFPTGGATAGSVFVSPNETTTYTVTCTNGTSTGGSSSCLADGEEVPAGNLCDKGGIGSIEWSECCSGIARTYCPAPNEPAEAYCGKSSGTSSGGSGGETSGQSASASATVSVASSAFSVSCSVSPSTIGVGSPAIWSSTVTGPSGNYSYSWSGTDGLSGTGSTVQKTYSTVGHKYGKLKVTYTPPQASGTTEPANLAAATALAAEDGNWVVSGPTTGYACVEDWATAMYADNSFNGVICPASNTCTANEIGTTCFTMTNTPPSCAYGGTGDHEIHITPYTCIAAANPPPPPPPGTQCPAGQTAVTDYDFQTGRCDGGTLVYSDGSIEDAVQFGLFNEEWIASMCGASEGQCCEFSFRSSNTNGNGGFPPNSYYQVRVRDGATVKLGEFSSFADTPQCIENGGTYTCGSMASIAKTSCVGGGCPVVAPPPAGYCAAGQTVQPSYGANGCQSGWQCVGGTTSGQQIIIADCSGTVCTGGTCTCTGPNCGGVVVTPPQCSDGADNDGDGRADHPADLGCSSPSDDDEVDGLLPQCSDGADNDNDARSDATDPGCHTDANAGNAASYDPNDPSELNTQCSDGIDNDGNGEVDGDDVGCTSITDNDESSVATLSLALAANATIVQYNTPAKLAWSAINVKSGSCRITGTNGADYAYDSGPLTGTSGEVTTTGKPLKSQVTFTLTCLNLVNQSVDATAVVRVTPHSGEF